MKKNILTVVLVFAVTSSFSQVNEKELLKKTEEAVAKIKTILQSN